MWQTATVWFDVAIVMSIFAIGNILFGHFEEHKAKWRRVLKVALVLAVTVTLAQTAGRFWAYLVLSIPFFVAVYVHLRWLPQHGVNGWTGEPKDRYYELIKAKK
jgi:hypothetical protein